MDLVADAMRWLFIAFIVLCTAAGCLGLVVLVLQLATTALLKALNLASLIEATREAELQGRAVWYRRACALRDWLVR